MRFYGESFDGIRRMPIKVFWALNRMIERVRSDEILAGVPALSTVMGGEHVSDVVDGYRERVGNPMIIEQVKMGEDDRKKLQALFGARSTQ